MKTVLKLCSGLLLLYAVLYAYNFGLTNSVYKELGHAFTYMVLLIAILYNKLISEEFFLAICICAVVAVIYSEYHTYDYIALLFFDSNYPTSSIEYINGLRIVSQCVVLILFVCAIAQEKVRSNIKLNLWITCFIGASVFAGSVAYDLYYLFSNIINWQYNPNYSSKWEFISIRSLWLIYKLNFVILFSSYTIRIYSTNRAYA